jgi:hypothetical protein
VTEIRRLTKEQMASFGYSMAELRQLAREHGVFIPRDSLHHELVHALTAAGIKLPPKQACLTTAGPEGRSRSGSPGQRGRCVWGLEERLGTAARRSSRRGCRTPAVGCVEDGYAPASRLC